MVEKPKFYRRFNDALIDRNSQQVSDLLLESVVAFGWGPADCLRLLHAVQGSLSSVTTSPAEPTRNTASRSGMCARDRDRPAPSSTAGG